jgi:predicted dehydrogenase
MTAEPLRFAAAGLNHGHIYGMARALLAAGAQLTHVYALEDDLAAAFAEAFPQAQRAPTLEVILEDPRIDFIASAAIPNERAPLGLAALAHGKDFVSDKPGFTSFEQLEAVRQRVRETGGRYIIYFGERFENRATTRAGELVAAGAVGDVVHTVGLGPHRVGSGRPGWFYQPELSGGILVDIASHQIDQFLHFTRSEGAEIVGATVANRRQPDHPAFRDVGDLSLRSDRAAGFIRVDWLTPAGLGTWGDGRLFLTGTEGYIEVRKVIDISGRAGGDHLFLVDGNGTRYLNCQEEPLPFAGQLLSDLRARTATAVTQEHVFVTSELALRAQALADAAWAHQEVRDD